MNKKQNENRMNVDKSHTNPKNMKEPIKTESRKDERIMDNPVIKEIVFLFWPYYRINNSYNSSIF